MRKSSIVIFIFISIIFTLQINTYSQTTEKEKILKGWIEKNPKFNPDHQIGFVIFEDDMNGNNSVSGLQSRGWAVINSDESENFDLTWTQGDPSNFSSFEGPSNGYVSSYWGEGNGDTGILDQWLITPEITVSDGDTISFWMQSAIDSDYSDSIYIFLSPDGGATLGDFSLVYNSGLPLLVPQGAWFNWRGLLPAGDIRIGIRYFATDYINANRVGFDYFQVLSAGGTIIFVPSVTTKAATNISTTSATLNGSVNPNGSTSTFTFEYGTTSSLGNIISTGQQLTGSTEVDVNIPISDLSPNTTYHYRITATNSSGTSNGSTLTFITNSVSSGDVDLEWRTLALSTLDWKVGATVTAELMVKNNGTNTASAHSTQLYLSSDNLIESNDVEVGTPLQYGTIAGGDSSLLDKSFTVPSVNGGIYYVGAIVDVNNVISEFDETNNNYSRRGKVVVGYPNSIQGSENITFAGTEQTSNYKMIGIPGDNDLSISQFVSGVSGEDWIAYLDNGANSNNLIAYDGTSAFNFKPGNGFWLLSKNPINFNINTNSVELESIYVSTDSWEIVTQIPLNPGWNIISNPFNMVVNWSDVISYNGISESIHAYNGSYSSSSILNPFEGYYFLNISNLTQLNIPYIVSDALPKKGNHKDINENEITISLLAKEEKQTEIIIGTDKTSLIGYDKFDNFSPPEYFDKIRMTIVNPNMKTEYNQLYKDYRESLENQIFDIQVKYPLNEKYKILLNSYDSVGDLNIFLVDQFANFHNIKEMESVILNSSHNINNLKLIIGNDQFIDSQRKELLPNKYSLSQNFPNPFNPITKILYSIPSETFVTIRIYDVIGNEVRTLKNSKQSPGNYEIDFQAGSLASGIYFYKLSADNFSQIKKMVLLK